MLQGLKKNTMDRSPACWHAGVRQTKNVAKLLTD